MPVKFATEKTLGKLTKWLRILGFDTCELSNRLNGTGAGFKCDRFRLTRTQRHFEQLTGNRCLFIRSNEPVEQLIEVIQALGITEKDINPFTRCLMCNTLIETIAKDEVRDAVPDYVWETFDTFQRCRRCNKIFWAGSHTEHGMERIKILFDRG